MKARFHGTDIECTPAEMVELQELYGNASVEPSEPTVRPEELEAIGWAASVATQRIPFAGARPLPLGRGVTLNEFSELIIDPEHDTSARAVAERLYLGEAPPVPTPPDWKRFAYGSLDGKTASRVSFAHMNLLSTYADGQPQFTELVNWIFGPQAGSRVAQVLIVAPVALELAEGGLSPNGHLHLTLKTERPVSTLPGYYFVWEVAADAS